jgi:hypothetical protein
VKKTGRLLGKITEDKGFIASEKNELRKMQEQIPVVEIKNYGLYFLYKTLMEREIFTLKQTFGKEVAGAFLSFSMVGDTKAR